MAPKKTMTSSSEQGLALRDDEFRTPQEVAAILNISLEEHNSLTANPDYPKMQFADGKAIGYRDNDVRVYAAKNQAAIESKLKSDEIVVLPPTVKYSEPLTRDPSLAFNAINIPTTGIDHTLCLAFSTGFSTQWSQDDILRWKKLVCGLVRSGQKYVSYQEKDRIVDVHSNIQDAIKWLLRTAVPLSEEELQYLNLHNKMLGDERQIEELKVVGNPLC